MSIQIGKVTIYFSPFIILLAIFVVEFIVITISINRRSKKIVKFFHAGEYDKVIKDGEKLLKYYQKAFRNKNTMKVIESLHWLLAISNFSMMNLDDFFVHITFASPYHQAKDFWLSLYYICQDNLEEAQKYYDHIDQTEENKVSITYLDSLICYKQGDITSATEKMREVYQKLNYPVLKRIANEWFYKE